MTYSSSMALSRQRYSVRNQNAVSFKPTDRRLGPISNTVALIILACLLGLLYLTQVTKTNAFGYTIDSLQQQQTQLKAEHDNLEVASARLQSLDRVAASEPAKQLVSVAPSAVIQD
jgi:hypothetical protein